MQQVGPGQRWTPCLVGWLACHYPSRSAMHGLNTIASQKSCNRRCGARRLCEAACHRTRHFHLCAWHHHHRLRLRHRTWGLLWLHSSARNERVDSVNLGFRSNSRRARGKMDSAVQSYLRYLGCTREAQAVADLEPIDNGQYLLGCYTGIYVQLRSHKRCDCCSLALLPSRFK
jgi:hypothetical protein